MDLRLAPDVLRCHAESIAHHTETPVELAFTQLLGVAAVATARRFRIETAPGHHEPTNLWLATALSSGQRKSAVHKICTQVLVGWQKREAKRLQALKQEVDAHNQIIDAKIKRLTKSLASTADPNVSDQKLSELQALEEKKREEVVLPLLWTSDSTPEKLAILLAEHQERMAWMSSEAGLFGFLAGRYQRGTPNLDLMLKSHSGDAEQVHRVGRDSVLLSEPLVTICVTPQPSILESLSGLDDFRDRGLLARFLYLQPKSTLGYRQLVEVPLDQQAKIDFEAAVEAILDCEEDTNQGSWTLTIADEARVELRQFALEIEHDMRPDELAEHAQDWAGKAPGATARIAGVLHALEHAHRSPSKVDVSLKTMQCAISMMRTFYQHSLAVLDTTDNKSPRGAATRVWGWISKQKLETFTQRDVHQALRASFKESRELEKPLMVLEERGYIRRLETGQRGAGRRSVQFEVNPIFLGQ
ncbi:YfjI family protein [Thioalkalivibrio sp. ALJ3]|uniref:YfjI family protein n=1 Tax=Thioalkalivibrio sp. ALJ3 TaxID=1240557 RepID=UPI0018CB4EF6|nr:YfjI family protein [Thioalkalivibrio sp. ALJ3]